jgi:phage baseplate assembly protein W
MPIARADKFTPTDVQVVFYSDFKPNLDLNPITGLIATVSNEDSVKQSIYFLLQTEIGERPIDNVGIGSIIKQLFFEPDDIVTYGTLQNTIRNTIENYEKRATVLDIQVATKTMGGNLGDNQIAITIFFSLKNINTTSSVSVLFKRVE